MVGDMEAPKCSECRESMEPDNEFEIKHPGLLPAGWEHWRCTKCVTGVHRPKKN
jgi:hypothetical protein